MSVKNKKKHGSNNFYDYLSVHDSVLKNFSANISNANPEYRLKQLTEYYYELKGDFIINTNKGTKINVKIEKEIEVDTSGKHETAKTVGYSYNASIHTGNLIRYCNPHLTHNKFHHKHDFTGHINTIVRVNEDEWPHISEFFEELINNF